MIRQALILLFLIPFLALSQTDTIAHLYTYGYLSNDIGEDIQPTSDGGFILVGSTASSGDGNTDIYLLKVDSLCGYQWSFALGGIENDWGYSVQQTQDKGYIVASSTNSYGNSYQACLMKRDSLGGYVWQKTYGGEDWDFVYDIAKTYDNGFVFCGETYNNTNGNSDVWVVKTNNQGDTLWTRTIGGSLADKGNSIIETADSNILVAGVRTTISDSTQAYVLKFDKDGVLIWDSLYGGTAYEGANDIITTQDGNIVFTGTSTSFGVGDKDYYVVKINQNGNIIWEQVFNDVGDEEGFAIHEISNGNLMNVGYTKATGAGEKDAKIFLITSGGWWGGQNSSFGGYVDDIAKAVTINTDGVIHMAGYTNSFGQGLNDLMIIRVDTIVKNQLFTDESNMDIAPINVEELSRDEELILIFPNPTKRNVEVYIPRFPLKMRLIDNLGREVYQTELTEQNNKILLPAILNGVFSMIISDSTKILETQKLIIIE